METVPADAFFTAQRAQTAADGATAVAVADAERITGTSVVSVTDKLSDMNKRLVELSEHVAGFAVATAEGQRGDADGDAPTDAEGMPTTVPGADEDAQATTTATNPVATVAEEARTAVSTMMSDAQEAAATTAALRAQLASIDVATVPRAAYDEAVARATFLEHEHTRASAVVEELRAKHGDAMQMIAAASRDVPTDGSASGVPSSSGGVSWAPELPKWLTDAVKDAEAAALSAAASAAGTGAVDEDDDAASPRKQPAAGGDAPQSTTLATADFKSLPSTGGSTPSAGPSSITRSSGGVSGSGGQGAQPASRRSGDVRAPPVPTAVDADAQRRVDAALADVRALTLENAALTEQLAHMMCNAQSLTMAGDGHPPRLVSRAELAAIGIPALPSMQPALAGSSAFRERGFAADGDDDGANIDNAVDLSPLCYDDAHALVARLGELVRLLANAPSQGAATGGAGATVVEHQQQGGKRSRTAAQDHDSGESSLPLDVSTISSGGDGRGPSRRDTTNAATITDPLPDLSIHADAAAVMSPVRGAFATSTGAPAAGLNDSFGSPPHMADESAHLARRTSTLVTAVPEIPVDVLASWGSVLTGTTEVVAAALDSSATRDQPSSLLSVVLEQQRAADEHRAALASTMQHVDGLERTLGERDATIAKLEEHLAIAHSISATQPSMSSAASGLVKAVNQAVEALRKDGNATSGAVATSQAAAMRKAHEVGVAEVTALLESAVARMDAEHAGLAAVLSPALTSSDAAAEAAAGDNTTMTAAAGYDGASASPPPAPSAAAVAALQDQLERVTRDLTAERQRVATDFDRQWQLECDANEAREELERLRAEYSEFVPAATAEAIKAEFAQVQAQLSTARDELVRANESLTEARSVADAAREAECAAVQSATDRETQLNDQLNAANASVKSSEAGQARLREELAKARHVGSQQTTKINELEAELSTAKQQLTARGEELEAANGALLGAAGGADVELLQQVFPDPSGALAAAVTRLRVVEAQASQHRHAAELAQHALTATELELSTSRSEAADAQSQLASALIEVRRLRADNTDVAGKLEAAEAKTVEIETRLSRDIARLTEERDAAAQREKMLTERVELLSRDPVTEQVRRHGLKEAQSLIRQVAEIAARETAVIAERDELRSQLVSTTDNLTSTTEALAKATSERDAARADAAEKGSDLASLREAHNDQGRKLTSETEALTEANRQVGRLEMQVVGLSSDLSSAQEEHSRLTAESAEIENRLRATSAELRAKIAQNGDLESENHGVKSRLAVLEADNKQLVRDNLAVDGDRLKLRKTIEDLKEQLEAARAAAASRGGSSIVGSARSMVGPRRSEPFSNRFRQSTGDASGSALNADVSRFSARSADAAASP